MKLNAKHLTASGLAILILSGLVACGEIENAERSYSVILTEVNPNVAPGVLGNGDIILNQNNLTITVDVTSAPPGVHRQGITVGGACPTIKDDVNGDGYVDGVEAQSSTGKTLIPLDGDLSSQSSGENEYPVDNYNYSETTSFSQMVGDLIKPDLNPSDSIIKLSSAEELTFLGKTVVVYGVAPDTILPITVTGVDQMTPQESLPIACGVIEKVNGEETGTTTGDTGTTTGTTTGETGTTGTTTGETGTTGTTTGETGTTTGTTTGQTGTTTGGTTTGGTTTGGETTGGETSMTTGGTTRLI